MKTWLIQSSNIRRSDDQNLKLINGLNDIGCPWVDFGVIPFTNEITNWENFVDHDRVFVYASTKVIKIFTDQIDPVDIFVGAPRSIADELYSKLKSGIYYDIDKFDMSQYISHQPIKKYLLNGMGETVMMGDVLDIEMTTDTFIKPGKDLKLFTGGVVYKGASLREHLYSQQIQGGYDRFISETLVMSSPVNILAEWRFFIVSGYVVAGSQYQKNGQMFISGVVTNTIFDIAQEYSEKYHPSKNFVMDLALTDSGVKIVEYNCINASGLYDSDVKAIALSL